MIYREQGDAHGCVLDRVIALTKIGADMRVRYVLSLMYVTVESSGAKPPELPRLSVLSLLGKSPHKRFWLFSSSPDAFSFFSDLISCSFATMLLSVLIVEAA